MRVLPHYRHSLRWLVLAAGLGTIIYLTIFNNDWLVYRGRLLFGELFLRESVSLDHVEGRKILTVLTFGQSNSANYGENRAYTRGHNVLNFHEGQLYVAEDPLLGATGNGGSIWTRLGPALVRDRQCDAVIFTPIGVGGSSVEDWAAGKLRDKLTNTIMDVRKAGLSIDHVLWMQGESDGHRLSTSRSEYVNDFKSLLEVLRRHEVYAPVWVSITTMSAGETNSEIQRAQGDLHQLEGVYSGPNTDKLDRRYRAEFGTHFNDLGLERAARMWIEAMNVVGNVHGPQQCR